MESQGCKHRQKVLCHVRRGMPFKARISHGDTLQARRPLQAPEARPQVSPSKARLGPIQSFTTPAVSTASKSIMDAKSWIAIVANFIVIAGLISYGFNLFAEYHATGRWAKNITGLLAGIGMLALAASMLLTPRNALVILQVAQTGAARVFLIISSVLLMAAIAAFGIINYSRPLRLWHQRRIGRDLRRGLPRIP